MTAGQQVGLVLVLAMVVLCIYAAWEFRRARFLTEREATQWLWYRLTGEWVDPS